MNPFEDQTVQQSRFVSRLNAALGDHAADDFWQSDADTYVSRDSVRAGAESVTVTLTRQQWEELTERAAYI